MTHQASDHPLQLWLTAKRQAGQRVRKCELAVRVGCSPSRITQILRYGDAPSLALAAKLSRATGIPIDHFVKPDGAAQ